MSNYNIHAILQIEQGVEYLNEKLTQPIEVAVPVLGYISFTTDEESEQSVSLPTYPNPLTGELIHPLSRRQYVKFLGIIDSTIYYSKVLGNFIDDDDYNDDISLDID